MKFTTATIITFIFFLHSSIVKAEETTIPVDINPPSGISGEVVDVKGKLVPNFSFAIIPMQNDNGNLKALDSLMYENMVRQLENKLPPGTIIPPKELVRKNSQRYATTAKTGTDGKFSVAKISPGLVQLLSLPNGPNIIEPDKKILSIQFGNVTIFEKPDNFDKDDKITFALPAGKVVRNVKITVMQRKRIHAQVVYANGKHVANAKINLKLFVERDNFEGNYNTGVFTDENGFFTHYMDESGVYTVSVKYKDLGAAVRPFQLDEETKAPENLVLKLNGNPLIPGKAQKPNQPKINPGKIQYIPLDIPPNIDPAIQTKMQEEMDKGVWVINPANGHAYKKIFCVNWYDAQQTAIKEESHLVSINNKEEHLWLLVVFGIDPCWIGLNDVEKEGEWRWDSGEPVTYTSWAEHEMFPSRQPESEKDFVAIVFPFGQWQAVAPDNPRGMPSPLWHITKHAIIEKDGLISKTLEPDTKTK